MIPGYATYESTLALILKWNIASSPTASELERCLPESPPSEAAGLPRLDAAQRGLLQASVRPEELFTFGTAAPSAKTG